MVACLPGRFRALLTARLPVVSRAFSSGGSAPSPCSDSSQKQPAWKAAFSKSFWSDAKSWKVARVNTARCLLGCSIGDFSMLFALQSFAPSLPTASMMAISMASGITTSLLLETVLIRRQQRLPWRQCSSIAARMSMASMLAMELAENSVDIYLTGGAVSPASPSWWAALAASLAAGYAVPLPYNYYMFKAHRRSCH